MCSRYTRTTIGSFVATRCDVMCTLVVVQRQLALQVPKPPCGSLASSSQIVWPCGNVKEYNKAYNAFIGDHLFFFVGQKVVQTSATKQ